jgi:catechol 2,3-dioxygenase-like lactoylglutathione lyase family enzyme
MDDLENLRKRAKHLVRQHRNRDYIVAERIRRTLPQFAGLTDAAVLDTAFALHDAQELIAMELGFDSWVELKEATPMSTPTTSSLGTELEFQRALGVVFVTNFERALAFYCDKLGFEVVYTYGEPPFWGEVRRDGIAFNLRHVDDSPWIPGLRDEEQLLSLSVTTTDAKALFVQYQAAGVEFQERLKEKPWKAVEFVVRDPDGNLVLFGSPV